MSALRAVAVTTILVWIRNIFTEQQFENQAHRYITKRHKNWCMRNKLIARSSEMPSGRQLNLIKLWFKLWPLFLCLANLFCHRCHVEESFMCRLSAGRINYCNAYVLCLKSIGINNQLMTVCASIRVLCIQPKTFFFYTSVQINYWTAAGEVKSA